MKTKTYNMKENAKYRFAIGTIALLFGILLILTKPDLKLGQIMLPNTLIIIGIIMIIVGLKNYFITKEIKYDERTQFLMLKAATATLSTLIYIMIITMLIGTLQRAQVDLAIFSSIILFGTIIVYKLFYWRYDKKN